MRLHTVIMEPCAVKFPFQKVMLKKELLVPSLHVNNMFLSEGNVHISS